MFPYVKAASECEAKIEGATEAVGAAEAGLAAAIASGDVELIAAAEQTLADAKQDLEEAKAAAVAAAEQAMSIVVRTT